MDSVHMVMFEIVIAICAKRASFLKRMNQLPNHHHQPLRLRPLTQLETLLMNRVDLAMRSVLASSFLMIEKAEARYLLSDKSHAILFQELFSDRVHGSRTALRIIILSASRPFHSFPLSFLCVCPDHHFRITDSSYLVARFDSPPRLLCLSLSPINTQFRVLFPQYQVQPRENHNIQSSPRCLESPRQKKGVRGAGREKKKEKIAFRGTKMVGRTPLLNWLCKLCVRVC